MPAPVIAFFDTKPYDRRFFDAENREHGFDLRYIEARLTPLTAELARGARAACAFVNDDVGAKVLDQLVSLDIPLVALRSSGYNHVDLRAAYGRVHVTRVPAYSPHAVAEHAVALLLALNRKTHKAYYRTREGNFAIHGLLGVDLHGRTAGVVGAGAIGRVLLGILKGFGMRTLSFDPRPNPQLAAQVGFEYVPLERLFRESDAIFLQCPLTPETYHLVNPTTLEWMKRDAWVINTGRGQLLDTPALIEALKAGRIRGAALDVYEEEGQYFFEDLSEEVIEDDVLARLLTLPNVLVTAHQGFFTEEALTVIARTTLANVAAFVKNGTIPNEICYRCGSPDCARERNGRCF